MPFTGGRSCSEIKFQKLLESLGWKEGINFVAQYKDENYPFWCDFYLLKNEIYIELNIYFMHGSHWYDTNSIHDKEKVALWEQGKKEHPQYDSAIKTWTIRDVYKRKIARENDLNYVVLWNEQDIDEWFSLGMPNGQDWKQEYTWKNN